MNLPNGAEKVLSARKKGMRPAGMLIVSLIGPVGERNHTIFANPLSEYDWRWIVDLDVCLHLRRGVKWKPTAAAIARAKPRWLAVWDVDGFKGADAYVLPVWDKAMTRIEKGRDQLALFRWPSFENETFAWGD